MRILFFGNGPRGVRCLEAVVREGFRVMGVVVHRRPGDPEPVALSSLAGAAGSPMLAPPSPRDPAFLETVAGLGVDLSVMAGYARILGRDLLSVPRLGTINLHGGRLPEYRGGSPVNWQIINGEEHGACSILYADEGIDTGDVLAAEPYEIGPDTTAGEATARTLEIFPPLLVEVLRRIEEGNARGTRQDPAAGRYWSKRHPWDGEIDWEKLTDREVHNLVRGLEGPGLPGAFTHLAGERFEVHRTRILEETICGPPGRIALKLHGGVAVICRNRGVLVLSANRGGGEVRDARELFEVRGLSFTRGGWSPPPTSGPGHSRSV